MPLYFEDYEALPVGHRWRSAARTIAEADVTGFAHLTGDTHPQHMEERYGAESPYGRRIAHGFLTISIASGLVYGIGLDEGASHAILGMTWRLPAPVFVGDVLHVDLTLTARRASRKHPDLGIVERQYDAVNQDGITVASGNLAILCKRRQRD